MNSDPLPPDDGPGSDAMNEDDSALPSAGPVWQLYPEAVPTETQPVLPGVVL